MILQGLVLMVVGIGMVFAFLLLLVLILTACEKIIPRFNDLLPDEKPRTKTSRVIQSGSASSTHVLNEQVAVAIAVAVAEKQKMKS